MNIKSLEELAEIKGFIKGMIRAGDNTLNLGHVVTINKCIQKIYLANEPKKKDIE